MKTEIKKKLIELDTKKNCALTFNVQTKNTQRHFSKYHFENIKYYSQ